MKYESIQVLLDTITDNYALFISTAKNLIKNENYNIAYELIEEAEQIPHDIIIDIYKKRDYRAYLILANLYSEELNKIYNGLYNEFDSMKLGEILLSVMPIQQGISQSYDDMLLFIKENYIQLTCPNCDNDLLDSCGDGIYMKGSMFLYFNERDKCFIEDDNSFEQEDNKKYYCTNCNCDVTKIVEDYI